MSDPRLPQSPAQTPWIISFGTAAALLFVFRAVLWPLALALVLSVLIDLLTKRITRLWPGLGRFTTFLLGSLVIGSMTVLTTFVVYNGVSKLIIQAPLLVGRLNIVLHSLPYVGEHLSVATLTRKLQIAPFIEALMVGVQGTAAGLALTLIYLPFLIAPKRFYKPKVLEMLRISKNRRMEHAIERTVVGVEAYIGTQTIHGLMIAVPSGLLMWAAGLENLIFWSFALFLLSFIPVLGVAIGSIAPASFALLQFPTMTPAVSIFITIQAISLLVDNLILPKIQAHRQNIDPVAGLLAVGMWTILWGVPGGFLAIPLTLALMYQLAQHERVRWIAILMSHDPNRLPQWDEADLCSRRTG